jgi:hypothetical protein
MASQSNKTSVTTNYASKSFPTFRYLATKFPSVLSLIFRSRATTAIGCDVSIVIFTASSRYSGLNFLCRSVILDPHSGSALMRSGVRKLGGASGLILLRFEGWDGDGVS